MADDQLAKHDSLEPLLPDNRVQKIAELLFVKHPSLPTDTDVYTFIVPEQATEKDGQQVRLREQAVFALESDNPRAKMGERLARIYKGKRAMTTAGTRKDWWDQKAKERAHYVSTSEDPAWAIFDELARVHLRRLADMRALD